MAKRIYQAKDKLVQRRVRGAMVVENMRTKKRRRVGKKDVEIDVNMARGPTDRFRLLDDLPEEEAEKPRRAKSGNRDNRFDRVPDKDTPPRTKKLKRMFREREESMDTDVAGIIKSDVLSEDSPWA